VCEERERICSIIWLLSLGLGIDCLAKQVTEKIAENVKERFICRYSEDAEKVDLNLSLSST
jgi:hypothetical protein